MITEKQIETLAKIIRGKSTWGAYANDVARIALEEAQKILEEERKQNYDWATHMMLDA